MLLPVEPCLQPPESGFSIVKYLGYETNACLCGDHIFYLFIFLESEMEDFIATSSSSSASNSSEESKESSRAPECSLRSGLLRSSSLRVTRTRAAQRKAGE